MNRIEIKADGPVRVTLNGDLIHAEPEPDRITITLTEREAKLVRGVCGRVLGSGLREHTFEIYHALNAAGVGSAMCEFDGEVHLIHDRKLRGYAHAEQLHSLNRQPSLIRLTMDRDVAVTLLDLMGHVACPGTCELDPIQKKLEAHGISFPMPSRFTGQIKWKKRRLWLLFGDLKNGKAYKLVKGRDIFYAEWEPGDE